MAISFFEDKTKQPAESDLQLSLSEAFPFWQQLKDYVFAKYPHAAEEWKYSGEKYGWGYRIKDKKRVIIYMTPGKNCFLVAFVFGEKATAEALSGNLTRAVKELIKSAKVYAEGRGFRYEIRNIENVEETKKLTDIKLNN